MAAAKKSSKKKSKASSSISLQELIKGLPAARPVSFKAGTVIFREGSEATNCYVVTKGKVNILKKISTGDEVNLATIKPGEFLGEMAMLSGESRSASAIAETSVSAMLIDHADFVALLKARDPFASRLSLQLSTLLATRCNHLLRLIAHQPEVIPLSTKKVPPLDVRAVLNRVYTLWAV